MFCNFWSGKNLNFTRRMRENDDSKFTGDLT